MSQTTRKPNTLEEAMECFKELLSTEQQVEITRMNEDGIGNMHHGLGQWLRNNWGLWDENSAMCKHMKSLGFMHADDMSHSLLREFWARMNGVPSKLAEEIEYYKNYWKKQGVE